jgi:hypothetical protein
MATPCKTFTWPGTNFTDVASHAMAGPTYFGMLGAYYRHTLTNTPTVGDGVAIRVTLQQEKDSVNPIEPRRSDSYVLLPGQSQDIIWALDPFADAITLTGVGQGGPGTSRLAGTAEIFCAAEADSALLQAIYDAVVKTYSTT